MVKADLVILGITEFFVAFTVRVRQGKNLCQPPLQAGCAGCVEEGFQLSRCPLLLFSEKNADRWLVPGLLNISDILFLTFPRGRGVLRSDA